eukprot:gene347-619_t
MWALLLIAASIAGRAVASQLQLVTSESSFKSASQISTFLGSAPSALKGSCPVVSLINCGADGITLANNILKTTVDSSPDGICLALSDSSAVLYSSYDNMFGPNYCGAKAADYCESVSGCVCVSLPSADLEENIRSHDQIFRRLLWKTCIQKKKLKLVILIDTTKSAVKDESDLIKSINLRINEISNDVSSEFLSGSENIQGLLDISIFTVDSTSEDKDAINNIRSTILDTNEPSNISALPSRLSEAWTQISTTTLKPILNPAQRASLFQVEAAYAAALTQSETAINQWRQRINQGKIVSKFGDRAKQLITGIQKTFFDRTTGTLVVRERAEKAQLLVQNIRVAVAGLFQQQLAIVESDIIANFKRSLLKLMRTTTPDQFIENQPQVLRDTMYSFQTLVTELEGAERSLGLDASPVQKELTSALEEIAKEFPESTAARLEALKSMDKQVKKPKRKKGKKAINFAINLVGMFRPPGYANLQGFVGYQGLSLFGIPVETLLGVQNDGDAPEIVGEDREHPLLRLQPKVHFDIDL